jgi:hypothetical protein
LVDGHDLDGVARDGMRRVELDRGVDPLADVGGGGVVVEALGDGALLEKEAELAQAREALGAVRHARDVAREGGALEEVARGVGGRAIEAAAAKVSDERARFAGAGDGDTGVVGAFARALVDEVAEGEREERWAKERGLGDAVVAIRESAKGEDEVTVECVLEEERAASRGVGDGELVEAAEEPREPFGDGGEDRDVAIADRSAGARDGIVDVDAGAGDEPTQVAGEGFGLELAVVVGLVGAVVDRERDGMYGRCARGCAAGLERRVEDGARRGVEAGSPTSVSLPGASSASRQLAACAPRSAR